MSRVQLGLMRVVLLKRSIRDLKWGSNKQHVQSQKEPIQLTKECVHGPVVDEENNSIDEDVNLMHVDDAIQLSLDD